ncbi:MAG: RloB family protein [Romboutsia sp.]
MARLNPMKKRSEGSKREYLGKVLIFCEGKTEENYFNHYAKILNNKSKYSHIDIELVHVGSDAKAVYDKAEQVLSQTPNKYKLYDKYLVFDCDAPKEGIENVIEDMKNSNNEYKLLLTNEVFEVWLIMHFEELKNPITKTKAYTKMADYLGTDKYKSKEKASEGTIRKVIDDGKNAVNAIKNAKTVENTYKGLDIKNNLKEMNPYTTVHTLVEKILLEI